MPENCKIRLMGLFFTLLFTFVFVRPLFAGITPPTTNYTQTPSAPNGNNDWYVTPVQFNLTATDLESGVAEIRYKIDNGVWQITTFDDTLNLTSNPSFEIAGLTSSGLESWEATIIDGQGTYTQDITAAYPGYGIASAKIVATGGSWHGINNKANFAVALPYENMSASVWVKTPSTNEQLRFKVYALHGDNTDTLITQSNTVFTGGQWVKISLNFTVNDPDAIGIYLDIGMIGNGTAWLDAVSITSSAIDAQTNFAVSTDNTSHTVEFYSIDNAGNAETHSCAEILKNCVTFKLDQTPPGNWNTAGAYRGIPGSIHSVYVYTNVEDTTAGLSVLTDKYQYKTNNNPTFGRYTDISSCNNTWLPNQWVTLISPPFENGANSAYLLTPKTNVCNSNWKICKIIKFYAEDMAGNNASKDYCINGPWIQLVGEGATRTNNNIDMLAEADGNNTDGLIEIGGNTINFFTSSANWKVTNTPIPENYDYNVLWNLVPNKTQLAGQNLIAANGVYYYTGNFEAKNQTIPNNYSTNTFNQIVFINGNLRITSDLKVSVNSTALFVVSGNVEVEKSVKDIGVAIIADGMFYTAYGINENETTQTLNLNGIYSASKFVFQRSLQGTNNDKFPSEKFTYQPKYSVQLGNYFNKRSVIWKSVD